jgi:hypothetical protein
LAVGMIVVPLDAAPRRFVPLPRPHRPRRAGLTYAAEQHLGISHRDRPGCAIRHASELLIAGMTNPAGTRLIMTQ